MAVHKVCPICGGTFDAQDGVCECQLPLEKQISFLEKQEAAKRRRREEEVRKETIKRWDALAEEFGIKQKA